VLLQDYRDLAGRYDKLVSIEMIEAVGWRDHDVEDDGVVAGRFGQGLSSLPVGRDVHGVALVLEQLLQQCRELALVLDEEEVHLLLVPVYRQTRQFWLGPKVAGGR